MSDKPTPEPIGLHEQSTPFADTSMQIMRLCKPDPALCKPDPAPAPSLTPLAMDTDCGSMSAAQERKRSCLADGTFPSGA